MNNKIKSINYTTYLIGCLTSLLILYYGYSLFLVRDRQANLVLGLCLALYYFNKIHEVLTGESSGFKSNSNIPETDVKDMSDSSTKIGIPKKISKYISFIRNGSTLPVERVTRHHQEISIFWLLALSICSLAAAAYIEVNLIRISEGAIVSGFTSMDYVAASILILLSIDVTRRAFGNILASIIILAISYAVIGPYLPSIFYHNGMDAQQILRAGALSMNGLYGFILEVGATWIAVYLLLAGFAKAYGILDWVVDASQEIGKLTKSGIVHVAVVSSMVMGMITGSGAANTATTGSFTIPMLKNQGVEKSYAGAIEAVASIGGQLVPPIMGVAAFIMADLLGVPYSEIIKAGLIPAFLFYYSIVISLQILIYKNDWTVTTSDIPDWSIFKEGFYYSIPFAVLLYYLVIVQYTPLTAGLYTVLTTVGVIIIKRTREDRESGTADALKKTVIGLRQGAVDLAPIIAILASIGVAIEMFVQTGLAQRLSTAMIGLSGNSLLLLLVLAMLVSLLFGMGMPAPAAYILTASLASTAMIQVGVRDITAHMFVFYFAMYSSLTPPVGPSTVIGANLAGASFLSTAKRAMQLALPGFLIPFAFVANDTLIYWIWPETVFVLIGAMIAIIGISASIWGSNGQKSLSIIQRMIYLSLSLIVLFASGLGNISVLPIDVYTIWVFSCLLLTGVLVYDFFKSEVALSNITARNW